MNSRFCSPGKLLPYLFYLLLSYLLMMCWKPATAQNITRLKPLQIGDTIPEVAIKNILHYKTPTAKLSDFMGKLLILDFWATWCSPCIAMIPKMDSLQKDFESKVQFLPVAYQSEKEVAAYMGKYSKRHAGRISPPEVVGDSILTGLFPHTYLPHYVWISPAGVVKSITGHEQITHDNIENFLKKERSELPQKKDLARIDYDRNQPFLVNGNGGEGKTLVYHSVLATHTKGIPDGFSIRRDSIAGTRVSLFNVPLYWYYRSAYGSDSVWYGLNRLELSLKAPQMFNYADSCGSYETWKEKYAYCYQLIIPPSAEKGVFKIMQQDLVRLFPMYEASLEKRNKTCWVLSRTSSGGKPVSAGGKYASRLDKTRYLLKNAPLKAFVSDMNLYILQKSPYPMINETGYEGMIDLDIHAEMSDMDAVSAELEKFGMKITLAQRSIDVLVIRDKPTKKI